MAWVASHLFVRSQKPAEVQAAIREVLRTLPPAELSALEDEPAALAITPALEGWIAVTGLTHWVSDLRPAAATLSSCCATRVVSSEIFGHVYRLRIEEHERGQRRGAVRTPQQGWEDGHPYSGPMPLYEDVEQRAYDTLKRLGIPVSLITLGTRPYGLNTAPQPIGEGMVILSPRTDPRAERRECFAIPDWQGDCPVVIRDVSRERGMASFEHRYVEGQPHAEAVDTLIALESALEERMGRAAPTVQANLTITYHGGVYQRELDDFLRARGRYVPPASTHASPPWWQFWRSGGRLTD